MHALYSTCLSRHTGSSLRGLKLLVPVVKGSSQAVVSITDGYNTFNIKKEKEKRRSLKNGKRVLRFLNLGILGILVL